MSFAEALHYRMIFIGELNLRRKLASSENPSLLLVRRDRGGDEVV